MIIGRVAPGFSSTNKELAGWPEECTVGICGMICVGKKDDGIGRLENLLYVQGVDYELIYIRQDDMGKPIEPYEVECSVGLILLGRTNKEVPITDEGTKVLKSLGFRRDLPPKGGVPTDVKVVKSVPGSISNNRVMVEGCANANSLLSRLTAASKGCLVISIDEKMDWRSQESLETCSKNPTGKNAALWFSSPCTGGTPWSYISMHRGSSTQSLIRGHWINFRKLWEIVEIASFAVPLGVAVFIEWPRGCRYWANKRVVRTLNSYNFRFADFDGCMYGLVAKHGQTAALPIKKSWRMAHVSSTLGEHVNLKCDRQHTHTSCSGRKHV
jgi:hypothetical protein